MFAVDAVLPPLVPAPLVQHVHLARMPDGHPMEARKELFVPAAVRA